MVNLDQCDHQSNLPYSVNVIILLKLKASFSGYSRLLSGVTKEFSANHVRRGPKTRKQRNVLSISQISIN